MSGEKNTKVNLMKGGKMRKMLGVMNQGVFISTTNGIENANSLQISSI